MTNFGYHYSRCAGGAGDAKAILAGGGLLAGALAVEWVVAHAIEVLAVTATCGALAVAAVVALMRWTDRRGVAFAARLAARREPATLTATVIPQVSQGPQPAIVNNYHGPQFHFSGADSEQYAARVIRQALTTESA